MPMYQHGSFNSASHSRASTLCLALEGNIRVNKLQSLPSPSSGYFLGRTWNDTSQAEVVKTSKGDLGVREQIFLARELGKLSRKGCFQVNLEGPEGLAKQRDMLGRENRCSEAQKRELAEPVGGLRSGLWLPWGSEVLPPTSLWPVLSSWS